MKLLETMNNNTGLRNLDDIINEIESEVSMQISQEAYNSTEHIIDKDVQLTTFKLMRDCGIRGMRLFMEKLQDKGII